jgi:hypothetical protein
MGRTLTCLLSVVIVCPALLHAQRDLGGVPARNAITRAAQPIPDLHRLALHAGAIFSGTVTSVEAIASSPSEIPAVVIAFHVERAIRGASPGRPLTIREWRGLWNDAPRYVPGQRLLLFLFPPSKLGLTSTVGGPLGRFRVDSAGNILFDAQQAAAFLNTHPSTVVTRIPYAEFAQAVIDSSHEARQ